MKIHTRDALLRKVLVKADMDLDRTETDWIAEMQIECQTFHLTIVEETTGCFVKLAVHCICARARAPCFWTEFFFELLNSKYVENGIIFYLD
jgi:hypothetical protein